MYVIGAVGRVSVLSLLQFVLDGAKVHHFGYYLGIVVELVLHRKKKKASLKSKKKIKGDILVKSTLCPIQSTVKLSRNRGDEFCSA
mmetsp:Transcript_43747/g.93010  ORF Transcript_43747/g.93010 Transcript_43747/m.93010 type:complete len:86 (+) Transcript_43747:1273-1530(+)